MDYCLFTKRLGALGFPELGRAVKAASFEAVDLTVRPGGHVEPSEAVEGLPRAAEALAAEGVKIAMITTDITSVEQAGARGVLEAAAGCGVRCAKLGYYRYEGFGTLRKAMAEARAALRDLAALAGELGVFLGCHNHSGSCLGAHLAHLGELVAGLDPLAIGVYFDPAHAVVEGSRCGWLQALDDLAPRVRMLAVKDIDGGFRHAPLGEGLVPWPEMVAALKDIAGQLGPVSVHADLDLATDEVLKLAASERARFERLWNSRPARSPLESSPVL